MIYLDSSAFVKRYLEEIGTDVVKSIISTPGVIASSKLTYPEMLSALMRKLRAGEIERRRVHGLIERFERDWYYILVLEFHNGLLQIIKTVLEKYPLKAADSIHLASALWLKHSANTDVTFVASDSNLLKAAQSENLHIVNPLDGTL
jgi:predicted nucleic acid-binding protein